MAEWYDNLFTDKPARDPFANLKFFDNGSGNLESHPTSGIGFLPGGSSGSNLSQSSAGSNVNWAKVLGTGATLASSAFAGGGGSIAGDVSGIKGQAGKQLTEGQTLASKGQSDIAPVLQYFKQLMSGDSGQILAATQPERSRVIDQYDAARKSAGAFTPRGGGQASTQQESRAREASDLANITAGARKDAAQGLAAIGTHEQDTGLAMQQQAQQQLAQLLGPTLQQNQNDTASTVQTYMGIAAMIAAVL